MSDDRKQLHLFEARNLAEQLKLKVAVGDSTAVVGAFRYLRA
jgi:hypothetical protein